MAVSPIPPGCHTITPYLLVKGAAAVLDFAKKAFAAEETFRLALADGTIMHAQMKIGDSMLMLAEAQGAHAPFPAMLYLYVPDVDAMYASAIQAGGVSLRPPTDEFYGDRACGVQDAAGNQWWIATHKEDLTQQEIEARVAAARPPA
jgi:uncharacterized glyoxalase superfamily protein PhnB